MKTVTDNGAGKADKTTVYLKAEVDAKVKAVTDNGAGKADKETVYSKEQINAMMKAVKENGGGSNQAELNKKLDGKADIASVYTRDDLDTKLALKQDTTGLSMLHGLLESKAEVDDVYSKEEADTLFALKPTFEAGEAAQAFWPEDGGSWLPVTVNSKTEGGGYNVTWGMDGSCSSLSSSEVRRPQ